MAADFHFCLGIQGVPLCTCDSLPASVAKSISLIDI